MYFTGIGFTLRLPVSSFFQSTPSLSADSAALIYRPVSGSSACFPGKGEDQQLSSICFAAVNQEPVVPRASQFSRWSTTSASAPAITYKGQRYIEPSLGGKQDITAKGLSDGSIRHPLSFFSFSASQHTNKLLSCNCIRRGANLRGERLFISSSTASTPHPFTCKKLKNQVRSLMSVQCIHSF